MDIKVYYNTKWRCRLSLQSANRCLCLRITSRNNSNAKVSLSSRIKIFNVESYYNDFKVANIMNWYPSWFVMVEVINLTLNDSPSRSNSSSSGSSRRGNNSELKFQSLDSVLRIHARNLGNRVVQVVVTVLLFNNFKKFSRSASLEIKKKSNQIKSNQIKSNQIKSNQIKSN
ncbi:hypothetical protein DDB_G0289425 [Dictyostelium discoideum AX4]|uniref:Uncharacterized protein n=1 Tax=Dictyostelium discoideum TaxID=44689 RepID=Q54HJ5_DICDI|nr:hypothetical protein DDB_G0289425 [Dictyostelium discoideum AX4]EAL62740.1 hypothetical protein DDB_G0289425 [Dictyostelium discoideum AX4]|eukprot:XP_636238.1 hypothetical protein DDB_G0289425 [Dictyostelium discoideum AX4]